MKRVDVYTLHYRAAAAPGARGTRQARNGVREPLKVRAANCRAKPSLTNALWPSGCRLGAWPLQSATARKLRPKDIMAISLTYFDFDGSRGLECRLALTAAGIAFKDIRLSREQWADLKPQTPFGSLPLLQEGSRTLAQSNAILGYIGRGHGLFPADPWEAAQHDAVMLAVEDVRAKLPDIKALPDAEKKAVREAFAAGWLSQWAAGVSAQIRGPFLSGEQLSVADIKLYVILRSYLLGTYDHVPTDTFARFPKLLALHAAVEAHPAIRAYFAARAS